MSVLGTVALVFYTFPPLGAIFAPVRLYLPLAQSLANKHLSWACFTTFSRPITGARQSRPSASTR
jgi:hypothetical protein